MSSGNAILSVRFILVLEFNYICWSVDLSPRRPDTAPRLILPQKPISAYNVNLEAHWEAITRAVLQLVHPLWQTKLDCYVSAPEFQGGLVSIERLTSPCDANPAESKSCLGRQLHTHLCLPRFFSRFCELSQKQLLSCLPLLFFVLLRLLPWGSHELREGL